MKRFKERQYNRRMLSGLTVGFIGAGNMAEALISGLLHGRRIAPDRLLASDINASKLARLREI
ncbi:MAG TPA: NAD(P)-binding domain-containing protein, partial [Nitrospira sp.]|nr:NAD(P)-binding domain-containing protein [Nitrospira sp.]